MTQEERVEKIDEYASKNTEKDVRTFTNVPDFSEFEINGKTYITDDFNFQRKDRSNKIDELKQLIYNYNFTCNGGNEDKAMADFIKEAQALIHQVEREARIDLLKQLWNETQPDIVPEGVEPDKFGKLIKKHLEEQDNE